MNKLYSELTPALIEYLDYYFEGFTGLDAEHVMVQITDFYGHRYISDNESLNLANMYLKSKK
jgi:hypothetical protein